MTAGRIAPGGRSSPSAYGGTESLYPAPRDLKFADSLLEGTGFELPVPREIRFGFRGLVTWSPLRRGGPPKGCGVHRSKLLPVRPMTEAGRSSWRSFRHFYGTRCRFRDDRAIGRSTARSVATRRALTPAQ